MLHALMAEVSYLRVRRTPPAPMPPITMYNYMRFGQSVILENYIIIHYLSFSVEEEEIILYCNKQYIIGRP